MVCRLDLTHLKGPRHSEKKAAFSAPPAFTNLFEFISRLSNHTGQNKHTFHSQTFTFAWAALGSVLCQATVSWREG